MSNPSTIWSQLSLPLSPAGSLPYVNPVDLVSIITDVSHYFYADSTYVGQLAQPYTGSILQWQLTVWNGLRQKYTDTSAVPGPGVIATVAGRAAFAAGTNSVVITGAPAVVGDICIVQLETNDATLQRIYPSIAAAGTITFTGNANATGITKFSYILNKVF